MRQASRPRPWFSLLTLGPFAFVGLAAHGQTAPPAGRPELREIPVPAIATALGHLPGVDTLPAHPEMPDVLTLDDGTRVTTRAQWLRRRAEMLRALEYYAVGHRPPAPGNVRGRVIKTETVNLPRAVDRAAASRVRYRLVRLTFGPGERLNLDLGVFTPVGGGPFPAILFPGGTPPGATPLPRLPPGPNQGRGENVLLLVGPAPAAVPAPPSPPPAHPTAEAVAAQHAGLFRRGYALVLFNHNDCAEDTTLRQADGSWAFRTTRFYPAYPGYDWGILAGWAWGASRIADWLETDPAIDPDGLIVTGVSRTGKAAMVAAAFDSRLMGAPVVTGGGGLGAYRFVGPRGSETLEVMLKKYPNWFSPQLHQFRGRGEKLPFDQHWFLALCAPRPFLALEGLTDTISLPEAVRQSFLGALPAYALFDAVDKLGVNYAPHGHALTDDDWTALMDFADRHLRREKSPRRFDRFPTAAELDAALAATKSAPP